MPTLELPQSPHAPGKSPVTIHYREFGRGRPLLILHGGWGYGVYPFDRQIAAFASWFRILIPDRSGYGHSSRVSGEMPLDFHRRAALETFSFLDALGIGRAALAGYDWGGRAACVGAALWPERCIGLVSVNSYLIQDIANALLPARPLREVPLWYQWYFQIERGRAGLAASRREIAKIL